MQPRAISQVRGLQIVISGKLGQTLAVSGSLRDAGSVNPAECVFHAASRLGHPTTAARYGEMWGDIPLLGWRHPTTAARYGEMWGDIPLLGWRHPTTAACSCCCAQPSPPSYYIITRYCALLTVYTTHTQRAPAAHGRRPPPPPPPPWSNRPSRSPARSHEITRDGARGHEICRDQARELACAAAAACGGGICRQVEPAAGSS